MPAFYAMTWEPKPRRWRIMHKGQLYTISCRKLDVVDTKESSYQAANEWWRKKLAEIERQPEPLVNDSFMSTIREMNRWDREVIQPMEYARVTGKAITTDNTVGYQVGRYLDLEQLRVKRGQLSLVEYDLARRCLDYFAAWLIPSTSVQTINPDKWEDYWKHLMGVDCSVEYRKKRFRYAKNLVTWLASKGIIPMPANLISRKYSFGSTTKKIPLFTIPEVRTLLDAATGQLELHLWLMVNCGFTQVDVSDLAQNEVDWKLGTITRKRSKTSDHEDCPTVTYKLWAKTFDLLKQYRAKQGDLVLLTKSGQPWITQRVTNGVFNRTDNTKSVYRHLQDFVSQPKPIKLLRKTSASLLETHPTYGRYVGYFLAHSPRTVRDKSYVVPSQDQFDAATKWLGEAYGL
jgi:hypothetical protein